MTRRDRRRRPHELRGLAKARPRAIHGSGVWLQPDPVGDLIARTRDGLPQMSRRRQPRAGAAPPRSPRWRSRHIGARRCFDDGNGRPRLRRRRGRQRLCLRRAPGHLPRPRSSRHADAHPAAERRRRPCRRMGRRRGSRAGSQRRGRVDPGRCCLDAGHGSVHLRGDHPRRARSGVHPDRAGRSCRQEPPVRCSRDVRTPRLVAGLGRR